MIASAPRETESCDPCGTWDNRTIGTLQCFVGETTLRRLRRVLLCLGLTLVVAAINLFGLALWRSTAILSNDTDAFLSYEKSPLLIEYEELDRKRIELERRRADGDPSVTMWDVIEVAERQREMYPAMVEEHNERWRSAQRVEGRVIEWSSVLATTSIVLAVLLLAVYWTLRTNSPSRKTPTPSAGSIGPVVGNEPSS